MTTENKERQPDFTFSTAHVVSYADLIEARAFKKKGQEKGDPKFGGTFVIDKEDIDLKTLQKQVVALLQANNTSGKKLKVGALNEEQEKAKSHVSIQVPWSDGTEFADEQKAKGKDAEYARGKILLRAKSKYQPALSALEAGKLLEFSTPEAIAANKKFFYSGAYVVPSVGLHYYEGDKGKPNGVSLYLNAVMFAKHGARIKGSSTNAAETFKSYVGAIKEEDPTGGAASEELDDEIPF